MSITNPSVGSVTVLTMRGRVTPCAQMLEEITRRGVDGHAYVQIGKRAPVSQLVTELDCTDATDVANHIKDGQALIGTFVSVVHPTGDSCDNVCVLTCEMLGTKTVIRGAGGIN